MHSVLYFFLKSQPVILAIAIKRRVSVDTTNVQLTVTISTQIQSNYWDHKKNIEWESNPRCAKEDDNVTTTPCRARAVCLCIESLLK